MKLVQPDSTPASRQRPRAVANLVDVVLARDAPLIPPGKHVAIGTDHWRRLRMFNTDKLAVDFVVFPNGLDQPGVRVTLSRHWHVTFKPNGRFVVGPHSDYCREWQIVTGQKARRLDRLAPAAFAQVCVLVMVKTVTEDRNQRPLHPTAYYSVIEYIIEVLAGGSQI
jgi:hypothetical protein